MNRLHRVGANGQVVIGKAIRDQLGIKPGWQVFQRVVDGHLQLHFIPPRHNRSLAGILAPHTTRRIRTDEEWWQAKEEAAAAWAEEAMAHLTESARLYPDPFERPTQ